MIRGVSRREGKNVQDILSSPSGKKKWLTKVVGPSTTVHVHPFKARNSTQHSVTLGRRDLRSA